MLRHVNFDSKTFYVTSDTHWCHNKDFIIKPRGYTTVEEMNEAQVNNWNNKVPKDGNVLFLGDFIFGDPAGEKCRAYLSRLNGQIHMLFGNHNSGVKALYREAVKARGLNPDLEEVYPCPWYQSPRDHGAEDPSPKVIFYGNAITGKIGKTLYTANHFSQHIWENNHTGSVCLSGHSHSNDKSRNPDCSTGKCLDCGVDNFPNLLNYDELMAIMDKRSVQALDHHHQ